MPGSHAAPLLLLVNPACGDGTAAAFVATHVLPALKKGAAVPAAVLTTERPGHAGELVLDFLARAPAGSTALTVAVAGGDGTVHEVVHAVLERASGKPFEIEFVLIPVGTANALFASLYALCPNRDITSATYKLQSVHAYLAGASPRPLAIMRTTLGPAGGAPRTTTFAAVVTSAALHASILHDSERLRAEHPSLARFKLAAQANIARWYAADVALLPLPAPLPGTGTAVLRYTPGGALAPAQDTALAGPFAYFLSTANVDRLEPDFCIAPLVVRQPAAGPALDVVVLRPGRDGALAGAGAPQDVFADKVGRVLGAAYAEGAHVDMVFAPDADGGVRAHSAGAGEPVVEYFRCGGWEWTPRADADEHARLVCADGAVLALEPGECARCTVSEPLADAPRFSVFGRS